MRVEVETRSVDGLTTALGTAGKSTVSVDLPVDAGGSGRGCTGEQLLCLAVAGSVSNGLWREARARRMELTRVVVRVRADFSDDAMSAAGGLPVRGIEYEVGVDGDALTDDLRSLVATVDGAAEIPRLLRRGTDVTLAKAVVRSEFPVRTLEEALAVCRFMEQEWTGPWWVGGGWAIDLWAGGASRTHEDVEICVPRSDQAALRTLVADWQSASPREGRWTPLAEGELLQPPAFMWQLRRTARTQERVEGMPPRWEFLLADVEDGAWVFPRDPGLRLPLDRVIVRSQLGPPVVAPELVLLLKAFHPPRAKDEHDFLWARERLSQEQRTWLKSQLERLAPGHRWVAKLA